MKSPSDWLGLFAYKSLARFGQLCYIIYRKYIIKAFCPKIAEKRAFGVAVFLSTKHISAVRSNFRLRRVAVKKFAVMILEESGYAEFYEKRYRNVVS